MYGLAGLLDRFEPLRVVSPDLIHVPFLWQLLQLLLVEDTNELNPKSDRPARTLLSDNSPFSSAPDKYARGEQIGGDFLIR